MADALSGWPEPPRFSLPPGQYPLPHTWGESQIERLLWLLQRGLQPPPVIARTRYPQLDAPPNTALLLVEVGGTEDLGSAEEPEPGMVPEAVLTARLKSCQCPHVLLWRRSPSPDSDSALGWLERYLKSPILRLLRQRVCEGVPAASHPPLADALRRAAALTADPLELWTWVERWPIAEAAPSDPPDRPEYELLQVAGASLGERLAALSPDQTAAALSILWADPEQPIVSTQATLSTQGRLGCETLARLGQARIVAGDVSLSPLARDALRVPIAQGLRAALSNHLPSEWDDSSVGFERMLLFSRRLVWHGDPQAALAQVERLAAQVTSGTQAWIDVERMRAELWIGQGRLDEADQHLRARVLPAARALADADRCARTWGLLAEIQRIRGQLDEALRILRDEQLPVYETLGDIYSRAVTLGQIAEIYRARGQLDEALRIHREEELPVYEKLADIRLSAMTLGKIADIVQARGQLDEALRIHREEQLPVYGTLGDIRSRAVTLGKIADIIESRGQLDEALRIRREEQLPVFEKLGDIRSRALALGQIADIHQARGQLDEALRIRRDEELPVYQKLGDIRERAVTLGKIADIHQARGQLDEALRIHREEALPVYEKLGDIRERAVTLGKIADIVQARGQFDEALRIRRDEELPVYKKLGAIREHAVTLGQIADIYQARGQLDEALRIRREEELPVYEKLSDIRERAVTLSKIAGISAAKGKRSEALWLLQGEVLPILEKLKLRREVLVCESNIAGILLRRQRAGDRAEALRLLQHALTEATAMQIPEVETIRGLLAQAEAKAAAPKHKGPTQRPRRR